MLNQTLENNLVLMTIAEAASFLKVSKKTLYVYTCKSSSAGGQKRNSFPKELYVKIGRKVLFIKSKLIAWINSGAQFN